MTTLLEAEATAEAAPGEDFADRLLRALNDAALVVMTSIGHRTGLFDTMADLPPATAPTIAAAAGLAERYVREWLAVMVTAGVVHYDPKARTYRLPPAHAAWLTRAASPNNLAVMARMISVAAAVQDPIVERFCSGDGLGYEHYPHFHEVMAEDSGQTVVAALFDHILPLVPGLERRLEDGIEVVDVGCGVGRALIALAERFPHSRFSGFDLCAEAIETARAEAARRGLANLRFEARDLGGDAPLGRFDLITAFDAVHDQRDPQGMLDRIARALRPGGVFLMQDIAGSSRLERNLDHPAAPLLYAISTLHCTPVSLAQGGPGLGTMWGEELACEMLDRAGFGEVTLHRLRHDPFNVYFIARA